MNREKIKVGLLGATGAVGQKFITLLSDHPWFELTELVASERSAGKTFSEACHWHQAKPLPKKYSNIVVKKTKEKLDAKILFSAMDSSVAGEVETYYADHGYAVFSNSSNHRMDPKVPLTIPEINPEHFALLELQNRPGYIVTNSNCSTMFLAMALAPLHRNFGVDQVMVSTLQAISGAGYPGVASLDILGNVVPYIGGEEDKVESESAKILGDLNADGIRFADFTISASCNRVPVVDGHTECVSVKLKSQASLEQVKAAFTDFESNIKELPFAPEKPIVYFEQENRPQPKLDCELENGMVATIGRLRECPVLDYKFVIMGHNTVRGAAGASILNAEYIVSRNKLPQGEPTV